MGRADLIIQLSPARKNGSKNKRGQSSTSPSEIKHDTITKDESISNDEHVADILNDIDLFLLAKNGSVDDFRRVLDRISAAENASHDEILSRVSPAGNTLLHVAVKNGNQDIVIHIAAKSPGTILIKNFNDDTVLHLASKGGDDESTVRLLEIILRSLSGLPYGTDVVAAKCNLVMTQNKRGNTALLEALNHGRELVAEYWIQKFSMLSDILNMDGESAVYLAAKAGFTNCVSLILESYTNNQVMINKHFKKMSPIKAAIMVHNTDIIEAILSRIPSLIHLRDDEGNTPLHYAVLLGDVKEVRFLLDNYVPSATQRDNNGFCPIHLAAIKDRVDILRLLLRHCPAPEELLDTYGRNILHVAAVTGSYNVVKYILSNPNFDELINMKAIYGSTPLHLATLDWHPKIVSTLTWDKRVDVKLLNYTGMTALDVAENNMDTNNPPFRQRLTWSALKSAGTPRSLTTQKRQGPEKSYLVDLCKDRVNTLLVVSTLVATVTFAAGFTMPGGYNSSATDLGMATLLRHRIFHLFVFCDTIAMHCSIVVVVVLIFAQLGDLHLVLTALTLALPLLGVALSMMSLAFTAGISLVVGKLRWLRITVLVTGFTFLAILLLLFVPLCTYITSSNRILRYLSYYSFYFLMLATRSYD